MTLCNLAGACVFGLLVLSGCGDNDQTVNPGETNTAASGGGGDATGVVVGVSYDGQSVDVDLGTVATTSYKGVTLVKLSDVWRTSGIEKDRAALEFEFVASDGFTPSDKDCAGLSGTVLGMGYIDPVSRNLTWDESLGFQGCYSVRDAAQMNARLPTAGPDAGTDAE
jgi:hypothetical protein